jgi:hypothetical protein
MLAGLDKEGIGRELDETGEMAARADMSLTSPLAPKAQLTAWARRIRKHPSVSSDAV